MRFDEPLRRIVVPTDFSASARRALEWAVALAGMHQARLVLVHAVHGHRMGTSAEVDRTLNEAATRKLQEASRPIVEARLSMTTECRTGKPWTVICETARSSHADLIVIGSRGFTGLDRVLLGSTADRVLRTASEPVLTVHPTDGRPNFRHVLVASDFSESARTALTAARRLVHAATQPVRMTLLHVSIPPYVFGSLEVPVTMMGDWDALDNDARANLETIAASIRSERVQVTADVVRGTPVSVILDEARSRHVDMIAVGTGGGSALERMLLGSTAERVLHHAHVPVLTVHAPVPAEESDAGADKAHAATGKAARAPAR